MKYRTFVGLGAWLAVLVVVAVGLTAYRGNVIARHQQEAQQLANMPTAATADEQPPAAAPPPPDPNVVTDADREILRLQGSPLTNGVDDPKNGTRRWVVDEAGLHAEFRSDTAKGIHYWNRVKIDWNGNGKYDEKWNFRPDGTVTRRVAPSDDENYTTAYRLQGDKWLESH